MANKMRTFLFLCALGAVGYSIYHDGIGFGNVAIGVLVIVCFALNLRANFRKAKALAEEERRKQEKLAEREARKARRPARHGSPKRRVKAQKKPAAEEKSETTETEE